MVYSDKNLKRKANEAKKRLASGYFQKSRPVTGSVLKKQRFHVSGVDYLDEEKMYLIVKEMMERDEVVLNPIGCLMDRRRFEQMDYPERQRYVLKLSEIYVKLKARYVKENTYVWEKAKLPKILEFNAEIVGSLFLYINNYLIA